MFRFLDFYYFGPSRAHALKALYRLYPRYSLKRRVAFLPNAINLLLFNRTPKAYEQIRRVLPDIFSDANTAGKAVLLHKIYQNGRAYVFEFDARNELMTVTKVALTNVARHSVKQEYAVLQSISKYRLPFQVPVIINFYESNEVCALRIRAADKDLRIHDKSKELPSYVFDSIASLRPEGAPFVLPCSAFAWFDPALERVNNPAIRSVACEINADTLFAVSAAHRDLGSENVFSSNVMDSDTPKYAVIDWEFFTETAPAMTDRVSFWLGQHHRDFKRKIGAWRQEVAAASFLNAFRDSPGGVHAATFALIGLVHMGNDLAERLCGCAR